MKLGRCNKRRFNRLLALSTAVAFLGVLVPSANAYWDFSGNLPGSQPDGEYYELVPYVSSYKTRMTRATSGPKVRLKKIVGGSWLPPCLPGPHDCKNNFSGFTYYRSECEKPTGSNVWTNCRIASAI